MGELKSLLGHSHWKVTGDAPQGGGFPMIHWSRTAGYRGEGLGIVDIGYTYSSFPFLSVQVL